MPELPEQLDVAVLIDGKPFDGAWVELRLPMERKNDYVLLLGPTDLTGALTVSRADLENQVSVVQLSAFMDYSSLGVWRGELHLRPFDVEAVRRAQARLRAWPRNLSEAYPADALSQIEALGRRLVGQPGLVLELSAVAAGGSARVSCEPASTPSVRG